MSCNFVPRPAAPRVDLLGHPTMTYVQYTVYLHHFIRCLAISLRYNIVIYCRIDTTISSTVEKLLKRNHTHHGKLIDQILN